MTSRPPNTANAVLLVARLHASRLLNRMRARMGRGLARTGIAGLVFALFFGGLMMFNAMLLSSGLVRTLSAPHSMIHLKRLDRPSIMLIQKRAAWDRPGEAGQLAAKLGAVLLLMACCRLCMGISSANQDLGKVETSLEWLFTLPVSARALCLAQVLAYAVVDPFGWVVGFSFLLVVFVSAGFGLAAIPIAAAIQLYLGLLIGCCQFAVETILRKTFSPARLKNLQAIFSLAGVSLFFMLILVARPDSALLRLLEHSTPPSAPLWTPFAIPLLFCLPTLPAWLPMLVLCAYCALFPILTIMLFQRLVRNGLLATTAVYEGKRGRPSDSKPTAHSLFRGIIGKDFRLLLRDRNFLVQTLILPLLIVAYQIFFNASLFEGATTNFAHASTVAFGVGAYTLTSSAFAILAVEGNSLWMLYTFPRPLHAILLEKTLLWAAVALLYTTGVLAFFAWHNPGLQLVAPEAAMAVAGIVVYSFIASGIGVLATDPLKIEPGRRRFNPGMVYLYFLLAGLYGYALHSGLLWIQAAGLVIAGAAALILWRKVTTRLPWLLDSR